MQSRFKFKLGAIGVLLIALFVFINLTDFANPLRNFFYLISRPFQEFLGKTGDDFSDFLAGLSQAENLKKENEDLQLKIKELVGEKIRLQELKKENDSLREVLNLGLEKDFELDFAKVIGKDVSQDTLLINKGRDDGLSLGMPVITSQKILVGKIGQIFDDFSKVVLLSNKESAFDIKIGDKNIFGVAKGRGGNLLSLEFIPQEQEVEEGEFVATAALGNVFPVNLLVGQVVMVEKTDVEPFQRIEVNSAFEFGLAAEVFIIKN